MNTPDPNNSATLEARTFVVLVVATGFTAWEIGFDLGAFDNIDHRRFWAIWILSTIALVSSYLYRGTTYEVGRRWRIVLAMPTLRLIVDYAFADSHQAIVTTLALLSLATLPFALYLLARLLAGDFFTHGTTSQVAAALLTAAIFLTGLAVGSSQDRYLRCEDFARAGDYIPDNCSP